VILIALGSNVSGSFGAPAYALRTAVSELAASGIKIIGTSKIYVTQAHAYTRQPNFLNAAVTVATPLSADTLLQVLKRIEARAGREKQKSRRQPFFFQWMPRPLDLDIVCYKGAVRNWKAGRPRARERLVLPHPRAHERAFVLGPAADAAPRWHHPVFGLTAAQLLKRPAVRGTGKILGSEAFYGQGPHAAGVTATPPPESAADRRFGPAPRRLRSPSKRGLC
jgi:2-amino-4-hydroxy-6-hydroxymethyldihydropteridine diphosphokinase